MEANNCCECARAFRIEFRLRQKTATAALLSPKCVSAVLNFGRSARRLLTRHSFPIASVLVAACTLLAGCTTVDASSNLLGGTYIGIVRVATPPETLNTAAGSAQLIAIDAHALGLRIQNGIGAGYFHDESYEIPPDCRVVVFVQNGQQLDQLARQFAEFKEGICGTKR